VKQLVLLLLAACGAEGRFVRSDQAFVAHPGTAPEVAKAAPSRGYRIVGTIEVDLPIDATPDDIAHAAIAKAAEVGCDVLLDPATEKRVEIAPSWRLAHDADSERPQPEKPKKTSRFLCGVWSGPPTTKV
jgi:hypothetical protein